MLILAAGAHPGFADRYLPNPHLGYLLTPRHLGLVERVLASGLPWGVDYRSVRGFELETYRELVSRISERIENCLFVMAPPEMGSSFWSGPWEHLRPFVLEGRLPLVAEQVEEIRLAKKAGSWVHARDILGQKRALIMARAGVGSIALPHFSRLSYSRLDPLLDAAQEAAADGVIFGE